VGAAEATAHYLVEKQLLRDCLRKARAELPDSKRIVFVLKDLEDLEMDDIAQHLQLAPGTVRQRLHRARIVLQDRLRTHVLGGRS